MERPGGGLSNERVERPPRCAQNGLKVNQLHYWNRKFQPTDADASGASGATWVTLGTASAPNRSDDTSLVVRIGPATITVRQGVDPAFLQSLVQVLATC